MQGGDYGARSIVTIVFLYGPLWEVVLMAYRVWKSKHDKAVIGGEDAEWKVHLGIFRCAQGLFGQKHVPEVELSCCLLRAQELII